MSNLACENCANCAFFDLAAWSEGKSGKCRRRSPKRDLQWPQVHSDDWCGEFAHRPVSGESVRERIRKETGA